MTSSTVFLGGCNSTWEETCQARLPSLIAELKRASGSLAEIASDTSDTSRTVASYREPELSTEQRDVWSRWAQEQLVEIQRLKDRTEARSQLQEAKIELDRAANELVQFYAQSELGNAAKMKESLARVVEGSDRASALCKKK